MSAETAKKKGIRDGDLIELESTNGEKVHGHVKVMRGQHPLTVGIAACSGHWAKGMPIAYQKGTNFDTLIACDLAHVDPVSLNIETAARIKVRKQKR
jgi:anaerobic selenocysteine-containing dehydrogenase